MRIPAAITALAHAVASAGRRFQKDESGNFAVIAALSATTLLGFAGLGSDAAVWLYKHRTMQNAADSAAFNAATAYINDVKSQSGLQTQARSTAGSYGFTNGSNGVSVDVNVTVTRPSDTTSPASIGVTIAQPQTPLLAGLSFSLAGLHFNDVTVRAGAVALATPRISNTGCVLALNSSASGAITIQGSATVTLDECSLGSNSRASSALTIGGSARLSALSVSTVGGISGSSHISSHGITTGAAATSDPYATVPNPVYSSSTGRWSIGNYSSARSCDSPPSSSTPATIGPSDPTVLYVLCGGMTLNGGTTYLRPGIYIIDQGSLIVNGGAALCNTNTDHSTSNCNNPEAGVTLIFTSHTGSNYATAKINGGAKVMLTAPTSGPTKGIAFYGDRSMTAGTAAFIFNGGTNQVINGAIYATKAAVTFNGGSSTSSACTQLVADTIVFNGNSSFKIDCSNGMGDIGATPASVRLIQ